MKIQFFQTSIPEIQFIYIDNHIFIYPAHTHTKSTTLGVVLDGEVSLNNLIYPKGHLFFIESHQKHSLSTTIPSTLFTCSIKNSFFTQYSKTERYQLAYLLSQQPTLSPFFSISKIFTDFFHSFLSQVSPTLAQAFLTDSHNTGSLRTFKRYWNLTPHQFQIQQRIRTAQKQLQNPSNTLTQIALDSHFYDQSHFIHTFKKWLLLTPKEYQKSQFHLSLNTKLEKT